MSLISPKNNYILSHSFMLNPSRLPTHPKPVASLRTHWDSPLAPHPPPLPSACVKTDKVAKLPVLLWSAGQLPICSCSCLHAMHRYAAINRWNEKCYLGTFVQEKKGRSLWSNRKQKVALVLLLLISSPSRKRSVNFKVTNPSSPTSPSTPLPSAHIAPQPHTRHAPFQAPASHRVDPFRARAKPAACCVGALPDAGSEGS